MLMAELTLTFFGKVFKNDSALHLFLATDKLASVGRDALFDGIICSLGKSLAYFTYYFDRLVISRSRLQLVQIYV